jgi:hypothetical protein
MQARTPHACERVVAARCAAACVLHCVAADTALSVASHRNLVTDAMAGSLPARTAHAAARRDAANRARAADGRECPSPREHALVTCLLAHGARAAGAPPRALLRRYPRLFLYEWHDVWTSRGSRRRGDLVLASPAARSLIVIELKWLEHGGRGTHDALSKVTRERLARRREHVAVQAREMGRRVQLMFPRARVRAATCVNDAAGKLALQAVDF